MYCEACCIPFEGDACPACGSRRVRQPAADDLCFLTEQSQIWSDMLADVLRQHGIAFLMKGRRGAGLALKTGPMFEMNRFYVHYGRRGEALDLVRQLFGEELPE